MKHIYQDKGQTNSNHRKKIFQQKWNKRVQKELRIVGILSYWFLDIRRQAGSIKNSLNFCLTTWRNISFIYIMCVPFLFFVCALYFSSHHSRFFPPKWIRKIQANPARASDWLPKTKQKTVLDYIVNPILVKFSRSIRLDIGLVLFLLFYWPRIHFGPWKTVKRKRKVKNKKSWSITTHLDRTLDPAEKANFMIVTFCDWYTHCI